MNWRTLALVACCGLVGGCGGGGSGGIGSTPTPTPTPVAYTPPLPTMSPSLQQQLNLTQIPESVRWTGDTVTFAGWDFSPDGGFGHSIRVHYQGDGKYTVVYYTTDTSAESISYESPTIQGGFETYQKSATQRVAENLGYASSLSLFRANDSALKFQYLSYGLWEQHQVSGNDREGLRRWFLFGQMTPFADVPTSGSATYQGVLDGEFIGNGKIVRLGGTGSLTVDFSTLSKTGTMSLDQPDGLGGRKAFDSVAFDHTTGSTFTSANGMKVTTYGIMFGGPHAEEAALPFLMESTGTSTGMVTAIFLGKK